MKLSGMSDPFPRTKSIRRALVQSLFACGTLLLTIDVRAGSLTPPAGPIAPTMKSLMQVEPRIEVSATNTPGDADSLFRITAPGSYYLTGNIIGVAGKHGVEIAAHGVTVDLNGFDLVGVSGSLDGVTTSVILLRNIAVVKGSVRNWGDEGVDLGTFGGQNGRVEGVNANGNGKSGILAGSFCTVSNCVASNNSIHGIDAGPGCTVSHCTAYLNTFDGINAGPGSSVSNCTAYQNAGNGMGTNGGSTFSNCSAFQNTIDGFNIGGGSTVSNCTATSNSGNGIDAGGSGTTVVDCTVQGNTLDGIRCQSESVIRGNTCANNGNMAGNGAGIHVILPGTDNRIEGNNCTGADRGIDVDTAGNIIFRNTCSGNTTNWDVVAGNVCLVVQAATGGAILGNSGGASPGASDPIANYTY